MLKPQRHTTHTHTHIYTHTHTNTYTHTHLRTHKATPHGLKQKVLFKHHVTLCRALVNSHILGNDNVVCIFGIFSFTEKHSNHLTFSVSPSAGLVQQPESSLEEAGWGQSAYGLQPPNPWRLPPLGYVQPAALPAIGQPLPSLIHIARYPCSSPQ